MEKNTAVGIQIPCLMFFLFKQFHREETRQAPHAQAKILMDTYSLRVYQFHNQIPMSVDVVLAEYSVGPIGHCEDSTRWGSQPTSGQYPTLQRKNRMDDEEQIEASHFSGDDPSQ